MKIKEIITCKSKLHEEKINEIPIVKSYEYSIKVVVSPALKRMCDRILKNKRLFSILRHTKKNRTKKKLAKRIKKNNK